MAKDFEIIESTKEYYVVKYADGTTRKRFRLPGPPPVEKSKTEEINFWAERGGRM